MKLLLIIAIVGLIACAAKEVAPDPVFIEKVPQPYVSSIEDVGPEPTPTPAPVKKTFKKPSTVTAKKLLKKKAKKKKHLNPDGE